MKKLLVGLLALLLCASLCAAYINPEPHLEDDDEEEYNFMDYYTEEQIQEMIRIRDHHAKQAMDRIERKKRGESHPSDDLPPEHVQESLRRLDEMRAKLDFENEERKRKLQAVRA